MGSVGMAQGVGAPEVTQFSADTFAPGDVRTPKVLGACKKKKKVKEEKIPIIRRHKIAM